MTKERVIAADLMVRGDVFACFELVFGAAIRALGVAGFCYVQKHLGVGVPEFHFCQGAGAVHAAFAVQVFCCEFDGHRFAFIKLW